jgi:hypothetical protein
MPYALLQVNSHFSVVIAQGEPRITELLKSSHRPLPAVEALNIMEKEGWKMIHCTGGQGHNLVYTFQREELELESGVQRFESVE